jgi:hypothetical protein
MANTDRCRLITIKVTPSESEQFKRVAKKLGRNVADACRWMMAAKDGKPASQPPPGFRAMLVGRKGKSKVKAKTQPRKKAPKVLRDMQKRSKRHKAASKRKK